MTGWSVEGKIIMIYHDANEGSRPEMCSDGPSPPLAAVWLGPQDNMLDNERGLMQRKAENGNEKEVHRRALRRLRVCCISRERPSCDL